MKRKIYKRQNPENNTYSLGKNGGSRGTSGGEFDSMGKSINKRSCKEKMKWSPRSPFISFWDGFMLVVIVYSCFTSMYFAAIEFDICMDWIFWVENCVTLFFTLDIIFKFFRLPENKEPSQVSHAKIAWDYFKSGGLFFEVIATIPLYMIDRFKYSPCKLEKDAGNYSVILKLFRLVRIKRIFTLLEMNRVNKLVETLFSNQTRSKKVVFSLIMKNIYSVFRLILLTVIITYFIGCFFYLWSSIFTPKEHKVK